MNGRNSKKIRREVRRSYAANHNTMLARVIKDIENDPGFCLAVHDRSIKQVGGRVKRVILRIKHAWRLIDCSPKIRLKWRNDDTASQ